MVCRNAFGISLVLLLPRLPLWQHPEGLLLIFKITVHGLNAIAEAVHVNDQHENHRTAKNRSPDGLWNMQCQ